MKAAIHRSGANAGFALVDLLAMIACLVIILLSPIRAISKSDQASHAAVCLNNHRQMISAWNKYAEDNNGLLPKATEGFGVPLNSLRGIFVPGNIGYDTNPRNYDPELSVARSALAPYISDYAIWRCPSDRSTVPTPNGRKPRVRSISTSQVFDAGFWLPVSMYRVYAQASEIVDPAKTWVTMDEHADSLNDGGLAVQMAEPGSTTARIIDLPGSYHENGATMSFADGRVEIHPWKGTKIRPPVQHNHNLLLNVPAGDSVGDVIWLSEHTTVRK